MLNVTVADGKYTVIQDNTGRTSAFRYGDEWRDLTGDGLVLALAQEVETLRAELDRYRAALEKITKVNYEYHAACGTSTSLAMQKIAKQALERSDYGKS